MEANMRKKTLKVSELAIHTIHKNVTIASHIGDVIQDYKCLQKEKLTDTAGKYKRSEVLPPNTSNFRQNKLIRDLTELGDRLREEIEQCNRDDLLRQQRLEEVAKQTSDLAEQFLEAERAYNGVLKERETHNELMKVFSKEVKDFDKTSKRYARCGTALDDIRVMMETAIKENKRYTDFVKSLAGPNMSSGATSHALVEFIAEFERIESAQNIISDQMNEALSKAEKSQLAVMQIKNAFIRELKFTIEGLITSHSAMEHAGVMNERFEKALNTMSVDAVETMTTMAKVLNSADNMIENLIRSKAVDHSYRKKTLAQQFEVIRKDYVKKKAILHEYHKSRAKQDKKRVFMVQAFDNEELLQEKMDHQKWRLKDLVKKRGKMDLMWQRDLEVKKQKRELGYMPSDVVIEEEHYNPLEQPFAVVDLEEEEPIGRWSLHDPDDYEEESGTEEDEEDALAVYSGHVGDSLLVVESEEQVSFMMAAESNVADAAGGEKQRASIKRRESIERQSISSTSSGSSNSSNRSQDRRMSAFFHDTL